VCLQWSCTQSSPLTSGAILNKPLVSILPRPFSLRFKKLLANTANYNKTDDGDCGDFWYYIGPASHTNTEIRVDRPVGLEILRQEYVILNDFEQ